VECVKRLLAVLDKEDINAVCESESWRGKTVLQIAATENALNVLNELIAHEFTDLFITDTKQRTILHTLADSGKKESIDVTYSIPLTICGIRMERCPRTEFDCHL